MENLSSEGMPSTADADVVSFFFVRREYMTDDCELNVTQWVVSDRYALRALVLVQMSLLHSTIFPLAAYSP